MSRMNSNNSAQQGFTLVEMAVVLVVIGLILGAVMIGQDVQRNAEYTRIKQKFVDQWVVSYNAYVQRTGVPVGDDQTAPQLMVNGANFATASGGDMSGATPPGAICERSAGPGMGRTQQADASLRAFLQRAGVTLPPGRAEGAEDRYVYLDTNGNPQEIQICFQWNPPGTLSGAGNVMVITGLTPDLARALDQMIDGAADAANGQFRQEGVALAGADSRAEWAGNNSQVQGAGTPSATTIDAERRDGQVLTLVAHYRMNQ